MEEVVRAVSSLSAFSVVDNPISLGKIKLSSDKYGEIKTDIVLPGSSAFKGFYKYKFVFNLLRNKQDTGSIHLWFTEFYQGDYPFKSDKFGDCYILIKKQIKPFKVLSKENAEFVAIRYADYEASNVIDIVDFIDNNWLLNIIDNNYIINICENYKLELISPDKKVAIIDKGDYILKNKNEIIVVKEEALADYTIL